MYDRIVYRMLESAEWLSFSRIIEGISGEDSKIGRTFRSFSPRILALCTPLLCHSRHQHQ